MKKKILIYGVGPFGSLFAERLKEAGNEVFLIDRGQRQEDLKKYGIVIENAVTKEQTVTHVPVVECLAEEDFYDLVIIPVRKNQVSSILPTLAANKKIRIFLFMMNNAAGQNELVEALGQERVMIGFPLPGGYLDGHIVRMLPVNDKKPMALPIGEPGGRITERTRETAEILNSMRGYKTDIRRDMDAWLKTHVAFLVPTFVPAVYACNMDAKRFAETRDARVLSVRALREAFNALESAGEIISPPGLKRLKYVPEPIFVFLLSQLAKTATFQNALEDLKTKPDEIKHLADEFFELIRPTSVEMPAIKRLAAYIYQEQEPLPSGQKDIPLNWQSVYGMLGAATFAAALYKVARK
ncbi:ketopantoate reductase family protein [Planococcus shixiaomingii]|uniref:ketopantoate reductase family protein n=1 Tax=Planococcus shixiaomingii TaxID=3058393 RepID=UPI0026325AE9|nr:2-dehydropantoate 2-reductase N-terminal domain-containing protein [Planococcus sp. N022]WKA55609.1 2-dehydropantoate 2-reductase N-terminal domain-containing protein [Planococcus sp. N022]